MKLQIECEDCGYVIEKLYWDDSIGKEKELKLKAGRLAIHYCSSGGVYHVCIECPSCGAEMGIADGYDLEGLLKPR